MVFDQDNKVVQLCTKGMELEGLGQLEEAGRHFQEAWDMAFTDLEKFIAAHYLARHQKSISDKLLWDRKALDYALNIQDGSIKESLSSLYLNVAKCYEDLNDTDKAKSYYEAALTSAVFLPGDGYGQMIKKGITSGLQRISDREKITIIDAKTHY
jgi:rifampin ADP-ribosylating transferase